MFLSKLPKLFIELFSAQTVYLYLVLVLPPALAIFLCVSSLSPVSPPASPVMSPGVRHQPV